jgi:hypothetical protein
MFRFNTAINEVYNVPCLFRILTLCPRKAAKRRKSGTSLTMERVKVKWPGLEC